MKRLTLVALTLGLALLGAACGESSSTATTTGPTTTIGASTSTTVATTTTTTTTTTTEPAPLFPVTIETDGGPVAIETLPTRIVSLSPTATETLFAVGAGDQVVAVDEYSYYPAEAPVTDLSGFSPNIEAILSYSPDLLIIAESPNDLQVAVEAVGVPVLLFGSAATLEDVYTQIEKLGSATGHDAEAKALIIDMKSRIATATADIETTDDPLRYFHELDPTYYSITSQTFIGQIYGLLGLESIADTADPDGYGYPQLSEEYIIDADPEFIFLADAQCCGESPDTVATRPGWDTMDAVLAGHVIEVDADIASRWGPRIVDFVEAIADAVYPDTNS